MGTVIKAENIGKKYIIGHKKNIGGLTFRDNLIHIYKSIYQRLRYPFSPNIEEFDTEEFWALKDINFEVKQGDKLGIIGRNGAGKSTLLKILSRITHPTTGKIHIKGRVASLLEVGTGFHPELTGRENIYLNAAILGMKKNDVKQRFDEIVAFAEIEKFLDTPVKRYSSGMYVRLAFAVAAHLEPEILIVDEVLAVGDDKFQKKCLGKMEHIGGEDRTVLFVSHNMSAMRRLCNKGCILELGTIKKIGGMEECFEDYHQTNFITFEEYSATSNLNHPFFKYIQLSETITDNLLRSTKNRELNFKIVLANLPDNTKELGLGVYLKQNGIRISGTTTFLDEFPLQLISKNNYIKLSLRIPNLKSGFYSFDFTLAKKNIRRYELLEDIISFKFENSFELPVDIGFIKLDALWGVK